MAASLLNASWQACLTIQSAAKLNSGLHEMCHLAGFEAVAAAAGIRISELPRILAGKTRIDQEMAALFGYRRIGNCMFAASGGKND